MGVTKIEWTSTAEQNAIPMETMIAARQAIEPILIEAPVTDAWGGSKLAEWQWSNSLTIDCVEEIAGQVAKAALKAANVAALQTRVAELETKLGQFQHDDTRDWV